MLLICAEIPQNLMMAAKGTLCRFPLARYCLFLFLFKLLMHRFKVYSHSSIMLYFRKQYYLFLSWSLVQGFPTLSKNWHEMKNVREFHYFFCLCSESCI